MEVDASGSERSARVAEVPMITWPVQDAAAAQLIEAVRTGGEDVVIDKSRDMGASWLCLLVFLWFWLFHPNHAFLIVSRKEDLVDKRGDPDSMFWKLRFVIARLPEWMIPAHTDTHMHLRNNDNGSVIDGESTNENLGRGGRRRAILVDEAAAIRDLAAILTATDNATPCRIFNSTPAGPGAFSDLRFSGKAKVIVLGWWDHPEKAMGRHLYTDPADGKVKWHGPYRQRKLDTRSRREVSTNLDIDHMGAGAMFFDSDVLSRQRSRADRSPPAHRGDITCDAPYGAQEDALLGRGADAVRGIVFGDDHTGPWRFWIDLVRDPLTGLRRPPQDRVYVFGADVAWGMGASNSVISVFDPDTGMKAAEFASAMVTPDQLVRVLARAGLWFGGRLETRCALVAWESNGGGGTIGPSLVRLGYPWLYRHYGMDKLTNTPGEKLGWHSTITGESSKENVFAWYRGELATDRFVNLSPEALDEAGQIIWYRSGGIGPGRMEAEGANARKTHGDRVTADALACWAARRVPQQRTAEVRPPKGSAAERIQEAEIARGGGEDADARW